MSLDFDFISILKWDTFPLGREIGYTGYNEY